MKVHREPINARNGQKIQKAHVNNNMVLAVDRQCKGNNASSS